MSWKFYNASGQEKRATVSAPLAPTTARADWIGTFTPTSGWNFVTGGTWTEAFDDTGVMASGVFTAPVAGDYLVVSTATFVANATGTRGVGNSVNGGAASSGAVIIPANSSNSNTVTAVGIQRLAVGDTVQTYVYTNLATPNVTAVGNHVAKVTATGPTSSIAIASSGNFDIPAGYGLRIGSDAMIYRLQADNLQTEDLFSIVRASGQNALSVQLDTDASYRFDVKALGTLEWGAGITTPDTNLYRDAAGNKLKTDDALEVTGALTASSGIVIGGSSKITALGDPTAAQDAATKAYVDLNDSLWTTLMTSQVNLAAAAAGVYPGHNDVTTNLLSTAVSPALYAVIMNRLDPADYAVSGRTMQMRIVASFAQNAVANAATAIMTAGLYPVTPAGATTTWLPTFGAVAGNTAAQTGGAASSNTRVVSTAFTAPAAALYALAVAVSVATTAGSTKIGLMLQYRMV